MFVDARYVGSHMILELDDFVIDAFLSLLQDPSPSSFGRPEYLAFLESLGFGPFQSIPNMSLSHRLVRYFHHTGTFHLSTCEMGVLPFDWSAILGICFGGRIPP